MRATKLAQPVRLHDVVVRAELEPDHTVDLLPPRAHDDDRDVRARAKLAADGEAVDVGQPEIEQDQVGFVGVERFLPGRDAHDVVALAPEPLDERLRDRVFVFHDQHAHGGRVARGSGPPRVG